MGSDGEDAIPVDIGRPAGSKPLYDAFEADRIDDEPRGPGQPSAIDKVGFCHHGSVGFSG